ncbi:MAG: fumarylacetoacetate hydrolase family protein [Halolamina sp.]
MTRLARAVDGTPLVGDDEGFVPLSAAAPDADGVADALADPPTVDDATASRTPAEEVRFGAPLATFGKLFGIGLNYRDHAADLDEDRPEAPASFFKPPSTAAPPGGPIRLPDPELTGRVTAEAELAVVVGRTCRDVAESAVDRVVAGYLPVVDCTAEDVLDRNPRFLTRAKSFDSFLVVGPWIRTGDAVELDDVTVRTVRNGETVAAGEVDGMAFPPRELVAYHSRVMTLEPGDVLLTGTPGAVAVEPGDRVRAEVEGVGSVGADVVRRDRR